MKNASNLSLSALAALALLQSVGFGQTNGLQVDARLPDYVAVPGLSGGSLKTVGSETMSNIMSFWMEGFKSIYNGVNTEEDPKGSSNAFPALIAGQAHWGQMSRHPKKSEISDFKKRYGYEPTILPTSIDMLAVFVHKDNPVEGLSFLELDAIFSSTRRLGAKQRSKHWSQFVTDDGFARQPITCYDRNVASGTYGYFKDTVLGKGDYGPWVNELNGSSLVAQSVGSNIGGIGYSGIGFKTAEVKVLGVSAVPGGRLVFPLPEQAYSGEYPLSRFLYVVLNRDPRKPLPPLQAEFLKYIYSKQGQLQVVRDGYIPLTFDMTEEVLDSVGISRKAPANPRVY